LPFFFGVKNMEIMLILIVFMVIFSGIGVYYSKSRKITLEDFISARKSTGALSSMATVTATVLGAWILFSPAEAATWAGITAVICYAIGQASPILAFTVVGTKLRSLMPNGHSLNEFVWFRYGKLMYITALLIVVLYMFTFLAAELGAISRALEFVTGVPLIITMIQLLIIIPLFVVLFLYTLNSLGGLENSLGDLRSGSSLLDFKNQVGIEFGITLIIAILAANLFHQGFWQRIYAAKSDQDIYKGFIIAAIIVIPMIILSGFFGLWAVSQGLVTDHHTASISLFVLAQDILPTSILIILSVLALMLVMSSMDSLINGITSIFTSDLLKIYPSFNATALLRYSRFITIGLVIPAMFVGWAFQSVLYLFLIADLVCAAAVVPIFFGMYSNKLNGVGCFVSTIAGIIFGALFFPKPDLSGWWEIEELTEFWHVLASGSLLASFAGAIIISTGLVIVFSFMNNSTEQFDFEVLKDVKEIVL
jgi:Na+/proline symporter